MIPQTRLWSISDAKKKENKELRKRIVELERRFNLNSENSFQPLLSDGLKKKPYRVKSLRSK